MGRGKKEGKKGRAKSAQIKSYPWNPVDLVQIHFGPPARNGDENGRNMDFGLTWEMGKWGKHGPEFGRNGSIPGPRDSNPIPKWPINLESSESSITCCEKLGPLQNRKRPPQAKWGKNTPKIPKIIYIYIYIYIHIYIYIYICAI